MYMPPATRIQVATFGNQGRSSLFDLQFEDGVGAAFGPLGTSFDGWCVAMNVAISTPAAYSTTVYSSYETSTIGAAGIPIGTAGVKLDTLDSINWLLNHYDGSNCTRGEIQASIWALLGEDWTQYAAGLGNPDPARIQGLVQQALAADGFVPDAGQVLGVLLDVRDANGVVQQPILFETRAAKLGDHVWHDLNANGVQDSGEAGIAGATVRLVRDANGDGDFGDANEVLATTTTNANGRYQFLGLTPGLDYQVQFAMPSGFDAVSVRQSGQNDALDSDGTVSDLLVLAPGEFRSTVDAGFYRYASLGDRVWMDTNANGLQDAGEAGRAGVTVRLLDANGAVVAQQQTDAQGQYRFEDLQPGRYAVEFVSPTGLRFTVRDAGAEALDSDADPGTGRTAAVTLQSGQNLSTLDAGLVPDASTLPLPSLGDKVWLDQDRDGQQDANEPGVQGVTVRLLNAAGAVVQTQTTDAGGGYLFTDLQPGTYSVQFVKPDGRSFTSANVGGDGSDSDADAVTGRTAAIALERGDDIRHVDAGLVDVRTRLGDRVWEDANGNGVQDSGESGIAGVTVQLHDANGSTVGTTTTDANGLYAFEVAPGTYSVRVMAPSGYVATSRDAGGNDATDSDIGSDGKSHTVTVAAGQPNLTLDAGLVRRASLGDRVWHDTDGDGQQDSGEGGAAGVTVRLLNAAGQVAATQTTNANGEYLFTNLMPGTYSVEFVRPDGKAFTLANRGADASDSDADASSGRTAAVTLASGEVNRSLDAGLVDVRTRLGDRVWEDANGNGVQDSGESGIAGVTVQLHDANGNTVGTTTTDASGLYSFDVTAGTYSVRVVAPSGYVATSRDAGGNDATDSDIGSDGKSHTVTVAAGQPNLTLDAGLVRRASLGDRVWHDTDRDGQQDSGEAGAAGVTVRLLNAAGQVAATQTTNANGEYLFSNLMPGTYSVEFVRPNGKAFTVANRGADGSDSDADVNTGRTAAVTLASGEVNRSVDAGLVPPPLGSIGNRVWKDADYDGLQDAGELSLAGVRVQLLNAAGQVAATTTTDHNGHYLFDQLAAGEYSVRVFAPEGYRFTRQDQGSRDAIDNDFRDQFVYGENLVINGSFEQTVTNQFVTASQVPGWTGVGDKIEVGRSSLYGVTGATGLNVVEVDAHGSGVGGLRQAIKTEAGQTYELAFDLGERPNTRGGTSEVDVFWRGQLVDTLRPLGEAMRTVKFTVVGSGGQDALEFRERGADDGLGALLDNVVVRSVTNVATSARITLGAGEHNLDWDAGLVCTATIGDRVWVDWNHDWRQTNAVNGEGAAINVRVILQNAAGQTVAETYTDSNGNYRFTNLLPGQYRVGFDKSRGEDSHGNSVAGWGWAGKNVGGNDELDADADGANHATVFTEYTTLGQGEVDLRWDAAVTPIVLDLDGNGIQTLARANAGGTFDLFGNGNAVASGWISGGDGFLAVDDNGNGRIDSVHELFGGLAKGAGFAKLATFDTNGDGQVNAADERFAELKVWQDLNGNHRTDDGELRTLAEAGIASLATGFTVVPELDAQGNVLRERGTASTDDGREVQMVDVYFNVSGADVAASGVELPSLAELLRTDGELDALVGPAQTSIAASPLAAAAPAAEGSDGEGGELMRRLAAAARAEAELQGSAAF